MWGVAPRSRGQGDAASAGLRTPGAVPRRPARDLSPRSSRRSTRSATQLLVMHMVQHVLLLDIAPILLILGLTKGLLRPVTRRLQAIERRAGYLAHPAFAVCALRRARCGSGTSRRCTTSPCATPNIHVLEHLCFVARRLALLVAPALADPQPDAPGRAGAGRLHGDHQAAGRRARRRAGLRARTSIYPFYEHHPHYWGLIAARGSEPGRAADGARAVDRDGHRARLLFVQMLNESEREAQRAERYEVA